MFRLRLSTPARSLLASSAPATAAATNTNTHPTSLLVEAQRGEITATSVLLNNRISTGKSRDTVLLSEIERLEQKLFAAKAKANVADNNPAPKVTAKAKAKAKVVEKKKPAPKAKLGAQPKPQQKKSKKVLAKTTKTSAPSTAKAKFQGKSDDLIWSELAQKEKQYAKDLEKVKIPKKVSTEKVAKVLKNPLAHDIIAGETARLAAGKKGQIGDEVLRHTLLKKIFDKLGGSRAADKLSNSSSQEVYTKFVEPKTTKESKKKVKSMTADQVVSMERLIGADYKLLFGEDPSAEDRVIRALIRSNQKSKFNALASIGGEDLEEIIKRTVRRELGFALSPARIKFIGSKVQALAKRDLPDFVFGQMQDGDLSSQHTESTFNLLPTLLDELIRKMNPTSDLPPEGKKIPSLNSLTKPTIPQLVTYLKATRFITDGPNGENSREALTERVEKTIKAFRLQDKVRQFASADFTPTELLDVVGLTDVGNSFEKKVMEFDKETIQAVEKAIKDGKVFVPHWTNGRIAPMVMKRLIEMTPQATAAMERVRRKKKQPGQMRRPKSNDNEVPGYLKLAVLFKLTTRGSWDPTVFQKLPLARPGTVPPSDLKIAMREVLGQQ